jgi:flagellar motility protein MotE (MotC chaperone)
VRLRTFEDSQVEFQKLKTEFYEEVVFSDKAPDIEQYKTYYEQIDPDNAEYLYKQVVQQMETDAIMDDYIKMYSEMKPKQAAAIFDKMGDNLDLVAKILQRMDKSASAKILQVMDKDIAARLTKITDPE